MKQNLLEPWTSTNFAKIIWINFWSLNVEEWENEKLLRVLSWGQDPCSWVSSSEPHQVLEVRNWAGPSRLWQGNEKRKPNWRHPAHSPHKWLTFGCRSLSWYLTGEGYFPILAPCSLPVPPEGAVKGGETCEGHNLGADLPTIFTFSCQILEYFHHSPHLTPTLQGSSAVMVDYSWEDCQSLGRKESLGSPQATGEAKPRAW